MAQQRPAIAFMSADNAKIAGPKILIGKGCKMSSSFLYVIAIESHLLDFQILLNDIPVRQVMNGRAVNSQTKVNQWIIEGTNAVEIRLGLPSGGVPEAQADNNPGSFQLRLFGGEHGREPGPEATLVEYIWDAAAQPLGESMVTAFTKEFQAEISFGRWRWQDSPPVPLTESDKQEILQLIGKAHRALAEKDLSALTELLKLNSEEMSRAVGIEEEMLVMGQSEFFSSLFESDGWRMDPLEESELVFKPVAGGRLVGVTQTGGQPLLRGESSDGQYTSSFMFGRVAGTWHILRPGS